MSTPAGWYPDPSGAPGTRWWDGAQWSAHTQQAAPALPPVPRYGEYAPTAPAADAPAGYPPAGYPHAGYPPAGYAPNAYAPRAPVDVPTNTVWVWLAIAASIVPFFSIFLMDWDGFIAAIAVNASLDGGGGAAYFATWQVGSLLASLASWVSIAAYIVFSWLDWRELRRRGVDRPFHWAWSFFSLVSFGVAVYMIGRAVVLQTRTLSPSRAPLWVWIVATVVGYVVLISWAFWLIGEIFSAVGTILQSS